MKLILTLAFILSSVPSFAGLYQCKSPDAEPTLLPENSKKISYVKKAPYVVEYAKDERAHANKKPFLIYYAIDTEEPFMQISVKYELAELRKACERSEHVNYVAFLNSKVMNGGGDYVFTYCKNKTFAEYNIKQNKPDLHEKLKIKRAALWEGDQGDTLQSPFEFTSRFSPEVTRAFYDYPFAHPDFVYEMINLAISEESLFPSSEFIPYLNLKSHGNNTSVLSGLQSCQKKSKIESQKEVLKKVLGSNAEFLTGGLPYYFLKQYGEMADKIALGPKIGKTKQPGMGDYSLGDYSLGDYSLGEYSLGDAISGLGASEGLGAEFAFGLTHAGLSRVIHRLFNEKNERFVGFVMLESCDTNRKHEYHQANLPFVLGMYSAKSSLWYRNLNWWELLEDAKGSSIRLIEAVSFQTSTIDNIVVQDI
jgi:hypothetical protein